MNSSVIRVYPNPTSNYFYIEGGSEQFFSYFVYDQIGSMIASGNKINQKTKIDLSEKPAGLYFIKIKTENEVITKKIIKK